MTHYKYYLLKWISCLVTPVGRIVLRLWWCGTHKINWPAFVLSWHATLWCKSGIESRTSVDYLNFYKVCGICVEICRKLSLVHVIETLWLEKYHKHEACLYEIVLSYISRSVWIEVMESSYDKVKSYYCGTDGTRQVLDYQTGPMLTSVLTGFFYYCPYIWASQLIRRVFHMDLFFLCWVKVIRGLFFVMWRVFIPAEFDGLATKVLGDATVVYEQTLSEAFLNMSWRAACFIH